jgi:hypothetical protein
MDFFSYDLVHKCWAILDPQLYGFLTFQVFIIECLGMIYQITTEVK